MKFYSCSERTALDRKKEISKASCKRSPTLYDLAIYEGYSPSEVFSYLSEN